MGVEIYQGKPIFYSVGNFVFQNETVGFFPADAYERFVKQKLTRVEGIASIESSFALEQVKYTNVLPVT